MVLPITNAAEPLLPVPDVTIQQRVCPDAEFSQSTENGQFWHWSNSIHGTITPSGGEVGGKFTFVTGSAGFSGLDLYSKSRYPAINGMPFTALLRYRRTTAVAANLGLDPQIRMAVLCVDSVPPSVQGGVTELVIYPQSATLNTWTTITAPFSVQLDTTSATPYVTARLRFPLNYISSGTIEVDALNVFPSA